MKLILPTFASLCLLSAGLSGQTSPSFEVASVKQHLPGATSPEKMDFAGNRMDISDMNLTTLLMVAYDLKVFQISGMPAWATDPRTAYDIQAAAPGAEPLTRERARPMLQALLADRFQMRVHRETKDTNVYALVVGKSGSKMQESAADAKSTGNMHISGRTMTMDIKRSLINTLTGALAIYADRPVIDQTGLTKFYDFKLQFSLDATSLDAPPLMTAIQEQLGLKFEPQKAPIEVLVVDRLESPSVN